jgi:DNA-nicking Smr family endonuclease
MEAELPEDEPIALPIDGVLDLHNFRPKDLKDLVPDYLAECRARGIYRVRIIHGKGIGNLRRTVHAILARLPEVDSFALAGEQFGGWGATVAFLKAPGPAQPSAKP